MSYRWFGVLQLQQFVTYAVIVAYHDIGGGVASAVFILLCLHILHLCHFAVFAICCRRKKPLTR